MRDRRLRVLRAVVGARRVRQPERVDSRRGRACRRAAARSRSATSGLPDGELLHVDAVELEEVLVRRLEERQLIALEIERQHERRGTRADRTRARAAPRSRRRRSSSTRPRRARRGGARAASTSRRRCARIAATRAHGHELLAHVGRPLRRVEAMMLEQRHAHALDAEAEAGRVGDGAVVRLDAEDLAEVVLVVVERAHRRGFLLGDDRDEHLELEPRALLVLGEHLPAAAEERIARDVALRGQAERPHDREAPLEPHVAPRDDDVGRADAHELAHAERLHARRLGRRLVTEHPVLHVDEAPLFAGTVPAKLG